MWPSKVATRAWMSSQISGQVACQGRGHLGAAGVMDTDEQNLQGAGCDLARDLGCGQELVAGETLGQDRQERAEPGYRFQGGAGPVHGPLHALPVEDAVVVVGQAIHDPGVVRGSQHRFGVWCGHGGLLVRLRSRTLSGKNVCGGRG